MTGNKEKVTLAVLKNSMDYLKETTQAGFKGVHKRQDIANHTISKHEKKIIILQEQSKNYMSEEKYVEKTSDLVQTFNGKIAGLDKAITVNNIKVGLIISFATIIGVAAVNMWW